MALVMKWEEIPSDGTEAGNEKIELKSSIIEAGFTVFLLPKVLFVGGSQPPSDLHQNERFVKVIG